MNRFWIILGIVIVVLVGVFIATKPESTSKFEGDAKQVQPDDHTYGAKDAKVVLMEYGDFQCPSCGAAFPIVKEVKEEYKDKITFVYRHFPIISIHPNAFAAARASEAASNQGKFWEMHDKLFETQQLWGQLSINQQSTFEGYAKELGLNVEQFKTDYESEAVASRINRDVDSATQFNVQGTPTFILNGEKIETPKDKAGFESVLNDALKKAGVEPSKN